MHMGAEWITKEDPYVCYLKRGSLRLKDIHRMKVKGWKNVLHENGNKQASVAILF